MKNLAPIFIVASLAPLSLVRGQEESCYSKEKSPYSLFATKTSYFEVDNEEAEPIKVKGIFKKVFNVFFMIQRILIKDVWPSRSGLLSATAPATPVTPPSITLWRDLPCSGSWFCKIIKRAEVRTTSTWCIYCTLFCVLCDLCLELL